MKLNKMYIFIFVFSMVVPVMSAEKKVVVRPNGQKFIVKPSETKRVYKPKNRGNTTKSNWSKIKDLFL